MCAEVSVSVYERAHDGTVRLTCAHSQKVVLQYPNRRFGLRRLSVRDAIISFAFGSL